MNRHQFVPALLILVFMCPPVHAESAFPTVDSLLSGLQPDQFEKLATPDYTLVKRPSEEDGPDGIWIVSEGSKPMKLTEAYSSSLGPSGDLDGDGFTETLITTGSGGQTESEYWLVGKSTTKSGSLLEITSSYGEASFGSKDGIPTIIVMDPDGELRYLYKGGKITKLSTKPKKKIPAIAEVNGAKPGETGSRTFKADIDLDGKPDVVSCEIWERWGSLRCSLPRVNGVLQELSIGCDRFGALKSTSNGRRDFVCNKDVILKFNGTEWVESH